MTHKVLAIGSVCILALQGCSSGKPAPQAPPEIKPTAEKSDLPKVINTGAGESDAFKPGAKREKSWTIRWKSSRLQPADGGKTGVGIFLEVSGVIYRDGSRAATFRADRGTADSEKRLLQLMGNVEVTSIKLDAKMNCDRLTYLEAKALVKASGTVTVLHPEGELASGEEVWASPELDRVGSPEVFSTL